ncbi:DUF1552 domain-containing protein [Roseimicrobium gellanilyticum]|nr:DUF1552 domain-containing protein [Roseimicrobium gellanilyticum]
MSSSSSVSRRSFLRSAGTFMALPMLESVGFRAFAAEKAVTTPTRMAFLYIPNGVNMHQWVPKGTGAGYELSPTLQPLANLKGEFNIFSNLAHDKAESNGDGAGDHARATATFLTGCQAKKTAGSDIRIGQSVDQIAATALGDKTRLASMELSTDGERTSGRCDSGYSCAYQFNLSWKTETMPMAPEMDPRLVFERMFGMGSATGSPAEAEKRRRYQKSVLDFVMADAKSLQRRISNSDNRKLDEYFASVRDIETRIEKAERMKIDMPAGVHVPTGIPQSAQEHIRLMFDLLLLAFQTDSTRVATFLLAHDGSNRSFPEIGVPDSHHNISHHQNNPEKLAKIAKIDQFYMTQFAYFLQRMKEAQEGGKSLLDSSMIVYGGGISDGNAHDHDRLPVILAGRGNGTLNPGHHIQLGEKTPMTNLYLAMLDRMGVKAERIGDSTGVLEGI